MPTSQFFITLLVTLRLLLIKGAPISCSKKLQEIASNIEDRYNTEIGKHFDLLITSSWNHFTFTNSNASEWMLSKNWEKIRLKCVLSPSDCHTKIDKPRRTNRRVSFGVLDVLFTRESLVKPKEVIRFLGGTFQKRKLLRSVKSTKIHKNPKV